VETKVNYAVVGIFVLMLGAAFVLGILWLAGGLEGRKSVEVYRSIVNESVAGLNVGAPVKYLGVNVGKVQNIKLDPENPQQVQLLFAIEHGTPIKQDTLAVLKSQGLTGIAYVELSGGAPSAQPLLAVNGEEYPLIRSRPSLSRRLEDVLTTTLANLDRTSAAVNALLDRENRAAFKGILVDTASVMHTLAGQRTVITNGLAKAAQTADNTARATKQLAPMMARIGKSAESVEKMATAVTRASTQVQKTFGGMDSGVERFSNETLPEMDRLLDELGVLSATLKRVSDQTERDPSSLLWGRQPVAPGPGEKQ